MRRLEFDLLRYLRHEAATDGGFEPEHLELAFGGDEQEPVELAEGLRVRGTIDRVDVWDGHALVRDYKTGKRVDHYKVASWESENRFQAALYMLVVERLLGLRARRRGIRAARRRRATLRAAWCAPSCRRAGRRTSSTTTATTRRRSRSVLERARERIAETAERIRDGELCSSPDSCAWNGGCSYPSICRSEE